MSSIRMPGQKKVEDEIASLVADGKLGFVDDEGQPAAPPSFKQWQEGFRKITPKQLFDRFARAAGPDNAMAMRLQFHKWSGPDVYISHDGRWNENNNLVEFTVHPGASVEFSRCYIQDQGKGTAKRYLHTIAQTAKELDASAITLPMVLGVGGYAWTKFGAVPHERDDWNRLKHMIGERLDYDILTYTDQRGVEHQCQLTSAERRIVNTVLNYASSKERAEHFAELSELNRVISEQDGKPLTVGKALLMNTEWNGVISLKDGHPSYERFKNYTAQASEQLMEKG